MTNNRQAIQDQIDEIDAALAEAITSVTTDGTSTSVDLSEKRKERNRLSRKLSNMRRPLSMSFYLGGG